MTDFNRDTGGTSQRRGVYGDPWRDTKPPEIPQNVSNQLEQLHDAYSRQPTIGTYRHTGEWMRPGPGIPQAESRVAFLAYCVFVGAIAAGIVKAIL